MSVKRAALYAAVVLAGASVGAAAVLGVGWWASGPGKGKR